MRKLTDFSEYSSLRKSFKKDFPKMVSNLTAFPSEITDWIRNGELYMAESFNGWILIHRKEIVSNLFFISPSYADAEKAIAAFKEKSSWKENPIVIEEISKSTIPSLNIPVNMTLTRMTRSGPVLYLNDIGNGIQNATSIEKEKIRKILLDNFNPCCESIPSINEIEDLILKGTVVLHCKDGNITGLMICEKDKSTIHLRYWWVSPSMRNAGVGSSLLNEFFRMGEKTTRQILWVSANNENAINRYKHFGFEQELMFDYIHILSK